MTLLPLGFWPETLSHALATHPAVARVVVAAVRGSAPREPGAAMLVTETELFGTIGGGRLEWNAVAAARALLHPASPAAVTQRFVLAADLGQCCGGVVDLWIERFTPADGAVIAAAGEAAWGDDPAALETTFDSSGLRRRLIRSKDSDAADSDPLASFFAAHPRIATTAFRREGDTALLLERIENDAPSVWLYGAGHVGQALAHIIATLPLRLTWIDPRPELAPEAHAYRRHWRCANDPVATVCSAPTGAYYLIMTHSHALDYELCRAILQRRDFGWAGLIGSKSKAARFRSRLRRDGVDPSDVARLVCPIGVAGVANKAPTAIAVSVAAQILQLLEADALPVAQSGAARAVAGSEPDCTTCNACADARVSTPFQSGGIAATYR